MFVNIFIGFVFSRSITSNVPVFINSSNFSKMVFPIPTILSFFKSSNDLISVPRGTTFKYLFNSFIALI